MRRLGAYLAAAGLMLVVASSVALGDPISVAASSAYGLQQDGATSIAATPQVSSSATSSTVGTSGEEKTAIVASADPLATSATLRAAAYSAPDSVLTAVLQSLLPPGAPTAWNARGYALTEGLEALSDTIKADAVAAEATAACSEGKVVYGSAAQVANLRLIDALSVTSLDPVVKDQPNQVLLDEAGIRIVFWETNWDRSTLAIPAGDTAVWVNGLHITAPGVDLVVSHAEASATCVAAAGTATPTPEPATTSDGTAPPPVSDTTTAVGDTTGAVEETTGSVDGTEETTLEDTSETLERAIDEILGSAQDATGTVGGVVEETTGTVEETTGTVGGVVDETTGTVGGVVEEISSETDAPDDTAGDGESGDDAGSAPDAAGDAAGGEIDDGPGTQGGDGDGEPTADGPRGDEEAATSEVLGDRGDADNTRRRDVHNPRRRDADNRRPVTQPTTPQRERQPSAAAPNAAPLPFTGQETTMFLALALLVAVSGATMTVAARGASR